MVGATASPGAVMVGATASSTVSIVGAVTVSIVPTVGAVASEGAVICGEVASVTPVVSTWIAVLANAATSAGVRVNLSVLTALLSMVWKMVLLVFSLRRSISP